MRRSILLFFLGIAAGAQTTPTARSISERLTANALKADVSFLASDAMEGRVTPSKSLDIAAEFIASQFRRAGLEPGGDDGYFQTAAFTLEKPSPEGVKLSIEVGGRQLTVNSASMLLLQAAQANLESAEAIRVNGPGAAGALTADAMRGKPLVVEGGGLNVGPNFGEPSLIVLLTAGASRLQAPTRPSLRDSSAAGPRFPIVVVSDPALREALTASPDAAVKVTAHIPPPVREPVRLRNVIGVLPGSDPALKGTYVILSAHYDHLGVKASGGGEGDRIYNGANDNASSVASLIEMAGALAALPERPRRSIVFLGLFGEEVGEIGSLYYVSHPAFPLARTIANINLEQLGRTDSSEGAKLLQFNMTGFEFTTLAPWFQKAAEDAGVQAVNDAKYGDSYFGRSDNARFANVGIPSTTISVTYQFPDYHAVGDEWPKLDYANMAKIDCALALAAFRLANASEAPAWNTANPRVTRYVEAAKKMK